MNDRRKLIVSLRARALAAPFCSFAQQDYQHNPVRLVNGFALGGAPQLSC